ncbi:heavy-metal-associated domain-containing protein [Burkholderiaceae bacterium DAT-1]|nr:heavy-metal-associated domain-containing protein [Burkholderiaceae bacterium DAT-1]
MDVYMNVVGMTCGGCAASVERTLHALEGVISAKVDLPAAKVAISYDERQISPKVLADAIEEAGFSVPKS